MRVPCWIEPIVTHVLRHHPAGRVRSTPLWATLREGRAEGVGGLEQASSLHVMSVYMFPVHVKQNRQGGKGPHPEFRTRGSLETLRKVSV